MPVHVKGNTASKLFLVFVPGGPGLGGLNYRGPGFTDIEKTYAIAYTNQRQTGSTQGNSSVPNTIAQANEDLRMTIDLLKKRYGSDVSIFAIGHSFGAKTLAAYVTQGTNQNNLKGWIDMAGWTDKNAKVATTLRDAALQFGEQEIALGKNVAEWTPIVAWCKANPGELTDNNLPTFGHSETLFSEYIENPFVDNFNMYTKDNLPATATLSSLLSITLSGTLLDELKLANIHTDIKNVIIPSLYLAGKYDLICPYASIEDLYNKTPIANKKIVRFEKSGHQLYNNEPIKFAKEVTEFMEKYK
jgi:pimeloyl-ACP methyl ester carboxylesterase